MAYQDLGLEYIYADVSGGFGECDIVATDNGLVSAVLVSMFSWRRARDDDELPDPRDDDRRGGWADPNWGSRLWILQRRKIVPSLIPEAESIMQECLQWMISEGIATKIVVAASIENHTLSVSVKIYRESDTPAASLRWSDMWAAARFTV